MIDATDTGKHEEWVPPHDDYPGERRWCLRERAMVIDGYEREDRFGHAGYEWGERE